MRLESAGFAPEVVRGAKDPLFNPYKDGVAVDSAAARAAILAHVGSLERLRQRNSAAFDRLQQISAAVRLPSAKPRAWRRAAAWPSCRVTSHRPSRATAAPT